MIEITKPTVSRLVTLDDTDDYTAALTVYEHREKLTVVLTPEQLHSFAHEAQKLAEQLVRDRDAAKADAERPRTDHAFDIDTANHPTLRPFERYVWITRKERAGMGLWDREKDLMAWWPRPVEQHARTHTLNFIELGSADWLIWTPADTYRPFEIAVLS